MPVLNPSFEDAGALPGEAEHWALSAVTSLEEIAGFGTAPEEAWEDFDRWFATLLDASPRTARAELRVVLTGERSTIELLRSPADRWRPWRRLHLAALLREAA